MPHECFFTQLRVASYLHLWAETGGRSGKGISLVVIAIAEVSLPVPDGEASM